MKNKGKLMVGGARRALSRRSSLLIVTGIFILHFLASETPGESFLAVLAVAVSRGNWITVITF